MIMKPKLAMDLVSVSFTSLAISVLACPTGHTKSEYYLEMVDANQQLIAVPTYPCTNYKEAERAQAD